MTAAVVLTPIPHDVAGQVLAIALNGSLDFSNAEELRADLESALSDDHRELVLDMTGVDFCDSTGIRVLLSVRTLLGVRGGAVTLTGLNTRLVRIFRVTGLIHAFTVCPGIAEALSTARVRLPSNPGRHG
ncbi:STAS domain-containing protein [Microbispora sp. NPDC049125]|uniref:STAS domain-containing protein n=1 Tax=Microbispora sp. NPDC049125 TaxID=3154929 RepID=UPI00346520F6